MKKLILSFFVFSVSLFGHSQNKNIDSLKTILNSKKSNDTTKVKLYYNLAREYALFSKDSFSLYTNKALALSLKANNYLLPEIFNYKGVEYLFKSKPDSARIYLDKALIILDRTNNKKTKAIVYQNYSKSYEGTAEFKKRVDYTIKSIEMLDDDPSNQCVSIFNLGAIYAQSDMQDKALNYFRKSLKTSEIGKNINIKSRSLMALGSTYLQQKQLDSAEFFLKQSLEICKQTNSSRNYYETYRTLGSLYSKMQRFDESKEARLKARKYAEMIGDEQNIMTSIASLAGHYLSVKDYKKSSSLYQEFNILYEKNPRMDIGVIAYKDWAKAEGLLGNIEKSGELLDKYLTIKDSIYSKENRAIISDAETKYETEKKDKEIVEQQLEIEKSQAKTQTMTILIISLLLASILLWFVFQQRQKRIQQQLIAIKKEQEVLTLESLIEGEEKERLRIAKELHDGVNGDLSAIKYKLSSLLKMNNEVINEAITMIDSSCKQVRAISHNLVPPSLKDFNLIEAISNYCENMNSTHEPEISFQIIGNPIELSKKTEVNIFRIVQELVTNATKHAEAKTIDVQISTNMSTLQLTVEDNGKGISETNKDVTGIGLENLKSRVNFLNANLDVVSNKNGTSYTIAIDTNNLNDN